MRNLFFTIILILLAGLAYAQPQNLPLNREFNLVNFKSFDHYQSEIHTSSKPIIISFTHGKDSLSWLSNSEQKNYLLHLNKDEKKSKRFFSWLSQSMFTHNVLVVDTNDIYLTVDPLINVSFGNDSEDKSANKDRIFNNTRGVLIKGYIGEKFSFQTSVYENQTFAPNYVSSFVNSTGVMPGQGRVKTFKDTGYDYAYSDAQISYSPIQNLNFQIGNGKNFIGDGYRSILLSDNATNNPYLKANWIFGNGKLLFSKIHNSLVNLQRRPEGSTPESLFQRNGMSVHYLNWLATKWLNVGLFEANIWQTEDSTETLPFQYMQLNPIPFVNTLSTGFNNTNKSLLGLNTKIKLPFKTIMYQQLLYDGNTSNENQLGVQLGLRTYLIKNLTLQAEYNSVAPYTYENSSSPEQAYFHYNQNIAHPFGNNFNELIGILNYKFKRLFFQTKLVSASYYLNDLDTKLMNLQAHLGFIINPKNNLALTVGTINRKESNSAFENKTNYTYVSLSTSLRNLYYDF